jgi:hypothetical protein
LTLDLSIFHVGKNFAIQSHTVKSVVSGSILVSSCSPRVIMDSCCHS